MFHAVLKSLQSFGTFSEKDLTFFTSKPSARTIRKNDFILKEGAFCQAIYFIIDGSCIHKLVCEPLPRCYTRKVQCHQTCYHI